MKPPSYDAFGIVETMSGTRENRYRYTGEQFDDQIKLQYNRARWYDAGTGRFASKDPHPGFMQRPASLHDYIYANADPVNLTDPSGYMGLASVSMSSSKIIGGYATRAQVAFQSGRQAGGMAVRALGKVVERRVQEMIRQCFKGSIKREIKVTGSGGNRRIDFLLELKDRTQLLEVKYQAPKAASEAFQRLIAQIKSGRESHGSIVVFFSKATDAKQGGLKYQAQHWVN